MTKKSDAFPAVRARLNQHVTHTLNILSEMTWKCAKTGMRTAERKGGSSGSSAKFTELPKEYVSLNLTIQKTAAREARYSGKFTELPTIQRTAIREASYTDGSKKLQ
jgi:hypothetical protein